MGMGVIAECDCGFEVNTQVGGTRAGYRSEAYFPFFCKKCGLITVNVAQHCICPNCQTTDVQPYGKSPITLEPEVQPYIQYAGYFADEHYNYCPVCKRYTLSFVIASFVS